MLITTDPFAQLAAIIGGRPQVQLHGDDLPTTYSFTTWPGRKGSIDAVSTGSPLSARNGWAGRGRAGLRAAHFRPSSGQYVTFNAEAANYTAATAFTWYLAARIRAVGAQRNVLFLGSSVSGTQWRGLYVTSGGLVGMISNRAGSSETDNGTAGVFDDQVILGCSLDAAGNLLIKQLSAAGESTLLSTSHSTAGTLTVDRFSLGTAILSNTSSSPTAMWTRYVGCLRGVANDGTTMTRALRHIRDRLGCPLPRTETYAGKTISLPSAPARWYNGSLQTSAVPTVDDQAGNQNGSTGGSVTFVSKSYDFQNNAAAGIGGTGMILPAGSSPFTLIATVRRVTGRSWSTGVNYNFITNVGLNVSTGVFSGLFKYHYNGTLYSSGYDVISNWAAGQRHVVALTFDGSDLRSYLDGNLLATHTGVGARATDAELLFGTFNGGSGSWMHRAKDFAVYTRALSQSELVTHSKTVAVHSYDLIGEGDSNLARITDGYAPAGENGVWDTASRFSFPRAGWRTTFQTNLAASGRMIDTAGAIAVSATSNAATVDAAADSAKWTLLLLNLGANDIHQSLYGGDVNTVLSVFETYLDARIATGKYTGIVAFELPPSSNATFNGKINTFNAGLATLKTAGKLKGVVPRPIPDPSDTVNLLVENSTNDAKHWSAPANLLRAEALITTLQDQVPWHD